jgi:aspartate/methionine/tyrosine aminotransferase
LLLDVEVGPDSIYIVSKTEKYKGLRGGWMIRVKESISEVVLLLSYEEIPSYIQTQKKGRKTKGKKS